MRNLVSLTKRKIQILGLWQERYWRKHLGLTDMTKQKYRKNWGESRFVVAQYCEGGEIKNKMGSIYIWHTKDLKCLQMAHLKNLTFSTIVWIWYHCIWIGLVADPFQHSIEYFSSINKAKSSWSQWLRGLRRGSAAARLPGLWLRIPPGAWMSVSSECCLLSGEGLCVGLITHPEESYWVWCVWVWSWSLDNKEALAHWGLLGHGTKIINSWRLWIFWFHLQEAY